MATQVGNTAHNLIKSIKIAQRSLGGTTESHVLAMQTESVFIAGESKDIRRVFVKTKDSGEYFNIGWILTNDVDHCMICNSEFGMMNGKHHCRACGNIVCSTCCPDKGKFITSLFLS